MKDLKKLVMALTLLASMQQMTFTGDATGSADGSAPVASAAGKSDRMAALKAKLEALRANGGGGQARQKWTAETADQKAAQKTSFHAKLAALRTAKASAPASDAGSSDAGSSDAGSSDAGSSDAGSSDASN